MQFNTLDEAFKYLDTINNPNNMMYDSCKWTSYDILEWYMKILEKILESKPKRVVDIGSNLNQYGYLFANEDIEYIGIDIDTTIPNSYGIMQPIITDKIKYVQADYKKVKDYFKNDVIISCLCVGYQVNISDVECKRLIINSIDENGNAIAKEIYFDAQ